MTLGPVQFVVIGLDNDKQRGQVARELQAVSDRGIIRVLDLLAVRKERDGSFISLGLSELSTDERVVYGAVLGELLGLGAAGEVGAEVGAELGAEAFAEHTFGLSDKEIQQIAEDIPAGKTVLMVLYEHRWAVRLKAALQSAGGVMLAQGMVQPETLVELGALLGASDATTEQSTQQHTM